MSSRLSDKKSKVIVVDPSGPVRQMMADVVRTGLGFETVESRPSIQDTLQYLEVDTADWLILPLMADQPVNGLHLLKICAETPELKHVRISLFIEETESYVLPTAYELGLLSHHVKPFTKDSLGDELGKLLAALEASGYQEPLVAAQYLRSLLKTGKKYQAQLDLEKSLLDLYPGNVSVLLNLAEPQFHVGKKAEAKRLLSQVKLVDAALGDKVDEVAKLLFGPTEGKITGTPADLGGEGVSVLGIKTVVVVDPDETVAKSVEATLTSLGAEDVKRFTDGQAAWEHMEKNPEPDLVIMEWRIPSLSGPLLVQRIRSHGYASVPVVVLSSLLKPADMPLVREMGVATVINKPLHKDHFVPTLVWVMQQERQPTEHATMERKLRRLLGAGKKDDAAPLRERFLADPAVPVAKKKVVEAEWAFASGNYPAARDAAVEALKVAGDSIVLLNLLGKTFMFLRSFESALKCFKRAQELSPNNIERLCAIAETQTELGQADSAQETLDHAKTLDPDSHAVQEAEVKVAITGGDLAAAKRIMGQLDSLSSIVSYMNNKAVAHARCGYVPEAVELYRKTVDSIPDDQTDMRMIVRYNLALAQTRAGELEEAVKELDGVLAVKNSKVAKKAHSLRERLKVAIAKGQEFKLIGDGGGSQPATGAGAESEQQRLAIAAVEARKGEMCCRFVFTSPDARDARVDSLLAKAPRFAHRETIAREEAMGAERAVKAG